jgi:predicted permease
MLGDLKYGFRQLRRSPAFAITAVLTLALGIGANTAIFSLVDSVMLRPLPYARQDRLMQISGYFPKGWIRGLQRHAGSFESIAGYSPNAESNVAEADTSERVFGADVMVNAFDALGIHPELGRFFTPDEARSSQDKVVVLSDGYWRQHFAGNPSVVGQTIRIDGVYRQIIGVMPAGIHFPYSDTQFVVPVSFKGGDPIDPWNHFGLQAFGRLKDGVTPAQAQAELRRLHPLLLPLFPWTMPDAWEADTTVVPLLNSIVGDTRPRFLLLFAAVGLILLIACANVANLMLARAAGREREMAIRGALGATGSRLIRQLLAESVLVGAMAGVVGLMAAGVSLQALVRLLPADTPRLGDLTLRWDVFLFAAAVSVLTGVLFGLVPAVRMASPKLRDALQSGSRSVAGRASQFRIAMLLVVGQIGLSVVVITGAGLMLHSLYSLSRVDPGFQTDRIVTAEVSLDATACGTKGQSGAPLAAGGHCQAFFQSLLDRMRGVAGVENVALVDALPMSGWDLNYIYDAEGHPRDPRQPAKQGTGRTVSPDYFGTLGLRLVQGRLLTDADASGASRAAVINQKMAKALWPNQDPIGKHIIEVAEEKSPAAIDPNVSSIVVGVVSNTHHDALSGGFDDEVYLPLTAKNEKPVMYVVMRTRVGATQTAEGLRRAVASIDPQVPVTRVRTLNEVVAASASAPRSLTILLLGFGALAVVIGAVGVYSLIAYIVSWRTREIGIRLALGAQRWNIVRGVVGQSLVLAASGSALGLIAAGVSTRLLHSFLFEVSPLDPVTFCGVPVLMLLLALAAAWLPARRAASVDPMEALRNE